MLKDVLFICAFISVLTLHGQKGYFEFSPEVDRAYNDALDLKLNEATHHLLKASFLEPENKMIHLVENYIEFFRLFISENVELLTSYKEGASYRMIGIKEGDINSPYFLFGQAQIHLQSALIRLKFKEYFGAFNEVTRAYDLLEYNTASFPDFAPNRLSLGVLQAMIGTIPDMYRWGVSLFGLDGSIEQGMLQMKTAFEYAQINDTQFRKEAEVMYAFALLHLAHQPEECWSVIESSVIDEKESLLAVFIVANIALRTRRNDIAIDVLQNRPSGESYEDFFFLEYMLGQAKLHRLDVNADDHFRRFIERYKGKNYIKDAYRKWGWHNFIFHNGEGVKDLRLNCLKEGNTQVDNDKSAQKWAKEGKPVHLSLLKARLLFDGGYFERAMKSLEGINDELFSLEDKIELEYRKARILQMQKRYEQAMSGYEKVLHYRGRSISYMVANAALQTAIIHEELGEKDRAYVYYRIAIDLPTDEYANSLNQKAKAGMIRCGG